VEYKTSWQYADSEITRDVKEIQHKQEWSNKLKTSLYILQDAANLNIIICSYVAFSDECSIINSDSGMCSFCTQNK